MMGGKDAIAVFSKVNGAESFIKASSISNPSIEELPVSGDYKYPNAIFAAQEYLGSKDIHEFIGLYSHFDDAKSAVGKHGLALKFVPDSE